MTPKEKADELIEKFMDASIVEEEVNYYHPKPYSLARQCATIAVDEILKTFPNINGIAVYKDHVVDIEYWQQVKQEIENL